MNLKQFETMEPRKKFRKSWIMDKPHKSFESWNSRKLNPEIGMNNQMKVERFGQWMKLGKLQTQNMQKMLSGTMNELEKVGKYGTWGGGNK